MTESTPANGTPESAPGKITRKITRVPENLTGQFDLREKEGLNIISPGLQNEMVIFGGGGGGIDFADLRELLKEGCQLEISLNADFPKENAGKATITLNGIPEWISYEKGADEILTRVWSPEKTIIRFKQALEQEKTALKGLKEVEPSAEKFANAVISKNVYGKLPKGPVIDGVQIGRDTDSRGANDFYYYGPDKTLRPENNVLSLVDTIYHRQGKFPELVNSHIVSIAPSSPDAVNSILTIHFFQDKKAPDHRGYYTPAFVQVKLPNKATSEFLSEISKNPDLLEEFYQKVFIGLDGKEGNPGMRRAKADGFYLITDKNLEEVSKAYRAYDSITGYDQEKRIKAFFQNLGKHQYKNGQYGTGEAFQKTPNSEKIETAKTTFDSASTAEKPGSKLTLDEARKIFNEAEEADLKKHSEYKDAMSQYDPYKNALTFNQKMDAEFAFIKTELGKKLSAEESNLWIKKEEAKDALKQAVAEIREVFLATVPPERKQKMDEIFSKIVFHNNQLTVEDMDLWAKENKYTHWLIPGISESRYVGNSRISDAEIALLSEENLAKFKTILSEQGIGENGRARTALLVEFLHNPSVDETVFKQLAGFVKIIKQYGEQLKDYRDYISVMDGFSRSWGSEEGVIRWLERRKNNPGGQ